jgi:glycosyltransferase involved in cell wall biosynthesis
LAAPAVPALAEADAAERFRRDHPGLALPPLVVVVPAYEEAGTVATVVASVPATMAGLDTSVLVIDDGSGDGTGERAASAGALVCRLPVNSGQGAALRTGYLLAVEHGARYLATLDADGQWAAGDLPRLVEVVSAGEADLVSGTRDRRDPERWSVRGAGVVVFAGLIRVLTGARVTDPANGLRVMTAEVAAGVELRQPQFQAAELLVSAVCRGFRYAEVPVSHARRSSGASKKGGSLSYGWRFSRALVGTWWRERRRSR